MTHTDIPYLTTGIRQPVCRAGARTHVDLRVRAEHDQASETPVGGAQQPPPTQLPAAVQVRTGLRRPGCSLLSSRIAPELGKIWKHPGITGIRRTLLRASRYHLYFKVIDEDVVVLAIWSAVRGRGPSI